MYAYTMQEKSAVDKLEEWMRTTSKSYASTRSNNGGIVHLYVGLDKTFSVVEDIMDSDGKHHENCILTTYTAMEAVQTFNSFAIAPLK